MVKKFLRRGLTLVEVLIVVTILVILVAAGAMLSPYDLAVAQVQTATDQLWHNIFWAQSRSRTSFAATTSGINFATDEYTIFAADTYSAADPSNIVYDMPTGITISTVDFLYPGNTIYFGINSGAPITQAGDPNPGSITLTHANGYSQEISIGFFGHLNLN